MSEANKRLLGQLANNKPQFAGAEIGMKRVTDVSELQAKPKKKRKKKPNKKRKKKPKKKQSDGMEYATELGLGISPTAYD